MDAILTLLTVYISGIATGISIIVLIELYKK